MFWSVLILVLIAFCVWFLWPRAPKDDGHPTIRHTRKRRAHG
jgi:hypothetical protein